MKKIRILSFTITLLLISLPFLLSGQDKDLRKIKWERKAVAPGLIWLSAQTAVNDSLPQNINVLIADISRREVEIEYSSRKNTIVSQQASSSGALAAVNAGFFNMQSNGSVTYIRVDGEITDPDTAQIWNKKLNMTGSVLVDTAGNVYIMRAMGNWWYDSHQEFEDVLVTGPLLLLDKKKVSLPATSLASDRHPRTAIGTDRKGRVYLITVDGRAKEARGMTLPELTGLMRALKINDGVNLDGGGSTTMWIAGKPFNGVVNMPSDNRKFDHEGERPVASIIIIR